MCISPGEDNSKSGSLIQLRPGGAGFVLHSELFPTTGSEANTLPTTFMGPITGAGTWVEFVLGTPVVLNSNTTYGFDVSSPNSFGAFDVQPFFETAGTSSDPFASGAAYSSGPNGSGGDNTMTAQLGDRVLLLQLTGVPEPSALALIGLGGLAFLLRRRSWRRVLERFDGDKRQV